MSTGPARLSPTDIARLSANPSPENRAEIAGKIAVAFDTAPLSDIERKLASDIFRALVRDVEIMVRQALADNLKSCEHLPRDIAVTLANDVAAEVAAPVLECSTVLTDDDLVKIVRERAPEHRLAIARRATVSGPVVDALVDASELPVAEVLASHKGAEMGEAAMMRMLEDFGASERVNAPLARRANLPLPVAERLVTFVADQLREQLIRQYELAPDTAADLMLLARERATVGLIQAGGTDLETMLHQMHAGGRLTPSIVLRALMTGDVEFFIAALARRSGVPTANAHALASDRGDMGLKALVQRAGLPDELVPVFRVGLEIAEAIDNDGNAADALRRREHMIERVLTRLESTLGDDHVAYLLRRLDRLAPKAIAA
jgi:uncharacterized protein (DUF2336 family)